MRDFTADAPNTLWLAEIIEPWTRNGRHYLGAVKDAYADGIDGFSTTHA